MRSEVAPMLRAARKICIDMFFVASLPAVMVLAMFGVLPSWALACTAAAAGLLFVE